MHAIATADERNEIARLQSILVHVVFDRLYWIRKIKPIVAALPRFDQSHKDVQSITFWRAALSHHQALNLLQGSLIITTSLDRFDIHGSPVRCSARQSRHTDDASR